MIEPPPSETQIPALNNSLVPDDVTITINPPAETGFKQVLRNTNFLALWIGQVFSQLADKIYLVLAIAIVTSFSASNDQLSVWVSSIMIAFTIPAVLFGSLAGVFIDRWSKKAVLVISNLWRGGLVLGLIPLLMLAQNKVYWNLPIGFEILLVITFLVSTLTQFFAPAEQAAIPLIVDKKDLLSANSLFTTTMMVSVIVGFALGEPLLELADYGLAKVGLELGIGARLLVGGSYAIAGLILILVRTQEKITSHEYHVFSDLKDGFNYLVQNVRVRSALIQLVILFSAFAALSVLAVRLAEVLPLIKPSQFGMLLASAGVGIGVGAFGLGHIGVRFSHQYLSIVGNVVMAIALGGLSLLTQPSFLEVFPIASLILSFLLIFLIGVGGALVGVPMQTTIQSETPELMRGKVFGLQNNVVNIALSLPLALAGVAETILGLPFVLISLATLLMASGLLSWYVSDR